MEELEIEFSRNDEPGVHPHNATIMASEVSPNGIWGNLYFTASGNTKKEAQETLLKGVQEVIDALQKTVDKAK